MNLIKKTAILALTTAIASHGAYADKRTHAQEAKGGLTMSAISIIGAVAAGPAGFVLGALGGIYLAEQGKTKVEQEIQLEHATMEMTKFEQQITMQDLEINNLEKMIAEKMQFQIHFKTGDDQLSQDDAEQIRALSDFLLENDYMHVAVDGHADPRGSDEYNNVLSEERAHAVAEILAENGIESYRISTKGHGSSFASAKAPENYALDRKVKVQVFPSKGSVNLADIN